MATLKDALDEKSLNELAKASRSAAVGIPANMIARDYLRFTTHPLMLPLHLGEAGVAYSDILQNYKRQKYGPLLSIIERLGIKPKVPIGAKVGAGALGAIDTAMGSLGAGTLGAIGAEKGVSRLTKSKTMRELARYIGGLETNVAYDILSNMYLRKLYAKLLKAL